MAMMISSISRPCCGFRQVQKGAAVRRCAPVMRSCSSPQPTSQQPASTCSEGIPLEQAMQNSTCSGGCSSKGSCGSSSSSSVLGAVLGTVAGGATGQGTMNTLMGSGTSLSRADIDAAWSTPLGSGGSGERVIDIADLLASMPADLVFMDDEEVEVAAA